MAQTTRTKRRGGAKTAKKTAAKKKTPGRSAAAKRARARTATASPKTRTSRSAAKTKTSRTAAKAKSRTKTTRASAKRPARSVATKRKTTSAHRGRTTAAGKTTAGRTAMKRNATTEDERFMKQHAEGLSGSTQRARWIHSTSEHEEHAGQTLATRDHDVIKQWARERGAVPATAPGTQRGGEPGVLRFNFPDYGGHNLVQIDWGDWFTPFDQRDLVFLYQEHTSDGSQSNFFQLDNPDREHE